MDKDLSCCHFPQSEHLERFPTLFTTIKSPLGPQNHHEDYFIACLDAGFCRCSRLVGIYRPQVVRRDDDHAKHKDLVVVVVVVLAHE